MELRAQSSPGRAAPIQGLRVPGRGGGRWGLLALSHLPARPRTGQASSHPSFSSRCRALSSHRQRGRGRQGLAVEGPADQPGLPNGLARRLRGQSVGPHHRLQVPPCSGHSKSQPVTVNQQSSRSVFSPLCLQSAQASECTASPAPSSQRLTRTSRVSVRAAVPGHFPVSASRPPGCVSGFD